MPNPLPHRKHISPSFWEMDTELSLIKQASNRPRTVDLLIVGTGFTGLSVALRAMDLNPSMTIIVVDQLPINQALASTRNAGFACFGSPTELLDDIKNHGANHAIKRVHQRQEGLDYWNQKVGAQAMDYHACDGMEVFTNQETAAYHQACDAIESLNDMAGRACYHIAQAPGSFHHAIRIQGEGSLHPGKLRKALINQLLQGGVELLDNFTCPPKAEWLQDDKGWNIPDSNHPIHAKKVVIASNAGSKQLFPSLNVVAARGQLLMTEVIDNMPYPGIYHADKGFMYFKQWQGRLILGGGRNLFQSEENSTSTQVTANIQGHLDDYLNHQLFPNNAIAVSHRWAGSMAFGEQGEKTPIIQVMDQGVVVACRLGGMGLALAPMVAKEALTLLDLNA